MRVIFVTTGQRRLQNMRAVTEKALRQALQLHDKLPDAEWQEKQAQLVRLGKRFRFITLDAVDPQTLLTHPVWQVAGHDSLQTMLE
jgi:hypothetical protein